MDRPNAVGMVVVAHDLNLTRLRAFIFLEERFLALLCAVTDQRRENVLFYSPYFLFMLLVCRYRLR